MTSRNKVRANRENAKDSSGPKTANGRARSARNALRHGLSLPVNSNPALSEVVETLAREIAGPTANAEILELARTVAEAQIDFRRVRNARQQRLATAFAEPFHELSSNRTEESGAPETLSDARVGRGFGARLRREACNRHAARTGEACKFAIRAFDEAQRRNLVIV